MSKITLLINVAVGKVFLVAESLRENGIIANIVMGPYDIIAEADGDVASILAQVYQIDGVEKVNPQFS